MYTKCPECNSVFRITNDLLEIADGLVRCGMCDSVFNGPDHLQEDNQTLPPQDDLTQQVTNGNNKDNFTIDEISDNENEVDEDSLIEAESVPTAIRDDFGGNFISKPNRPLKVAIWTLCSILLTLFFLGQITYWQNVDLLPRPWVDKFCSYMGCASIIERDLTTLKILNRNIYTHPNEKNVLMITMSFVNNSDHLQPFPLLQIVFLDTQGQTIATRRFHPSEYLVNQNHRVDMMPPNQPIGARLEIIDPGSAVIAYEIEFY